MSPLVAAVALTFALVLTGTLGRPLQPDVGAKNGSNDKVWFLGLLLNNGNYVLSCEKHILAALTPENTTVVFFNLQNETFEALYTLHYPGVSIFLSGNQDQVIVVEGEYVTIFNLTTCMSRTIFWPTASNTQTFVAGDTMCATPNSINYYYNERH